MTSLASTLVGALLLWLWLSMIGTAIGWVCGMWFNPLPWLPSGLPHRREDDPAWDDSVMGWWVDDPEWYVDWPRVAPDDLVRRWAYKTHDKTQTQYLLTFEMVESQDLQVWEWIHRYRS